jgi:hypothetical protein
MAPRVPRTTIGQDIATAELFNDFSQSHVEIAREEFNSEPYDLGDQSIPESVEGRLPLDFHGSAMPMHSHHHHLLANMADVLFEIGFARQHSGSRFPLLLFLGVVVVVEGFVLEAVETCGHILTHGNQQSRLCFVASVDKVLARDSFSQLSVTTVLRGFLGGVLQQRRDLWGRFCQHNNLPRVLHNLAIGDASAQSLCVVALQRASHTPITQKQSEIAYLRLIVPF